MIIITVNNIWSKISNLPSIKLVDELDNMMSFYIEGYRYMRAFTHGYYDKKTGQMVHWDGKKHLLTRQLTFPTGLLEMAEDFLKFYNLEYKLDDKRNWVSLDNPLPTSHYTPRYYQQEALDIAIKKGRGGLRLSTGAGKTALAAFLTAKYNTQTMVYVIGKDLLYQFHREFSKILNQEIGIIGDGKCDIKQINICSMWTAAKSFNIKKVSLDDEDWSPEVKSVKNVDKEKIKKAIGKTQLTIYDEAHFLATDTLQSIYKASKKCAHHYSMSGTLFRDDGADLLLESVSGKKIYDLSASKLIDEGFLVPPKIIFFETPIYPQKLKKHYQSVYKKYVVENEVRNDMIEECTRKLINKGRKVLILVRQIAHGKDLYNRLQDLPLYFVTGEVDGNIRDQVKQEFENGDLKCLIASSVFDIGVDLPTLDALVLAGSGKGSVRTLQRIGRVIRKAPGKDNAIVVDFIDNAPYLNKHSAARIATYETEKRFKLSFPKGFDSNKIKRPASVKRKIK